MALLLTGLIALVVPALLTGPVSAAEALKPELRQVAEAMSMASVCRDAEPGLTSRIDEVVNGWWEKNPLAAEAFHALYFGGPDPEQEARQGIFEALQRDLLADAERARIANPRTFAERCRATLGSLKSDPGDLPQPDSRSAMDR
jgi:hypothetical protein